MSINSITPQLNNFLQTENKTDSSFYSSEVFSALLQSAIQEDAASNATGAKSSTGNSSMGYLLAALLSSGSEDNEGMMMLMAALSATRQGSSGRGSILKSGEENSNLTVKKAVQAYQSIGPSAANMEFTPSNYSSNTGGRSPQQYRTTINKFDVEDNKRYAVNKKGTGDTYCNLFVTDVTSAMGAEIPHFIDKTNGKPLKSSKDPNATALTANRMNDWLHKYGPAYGWQKTTADRAQHYANQGKPAVTSWRNNLGGHGHIQVVSPSQNNAYDPDRGVAIAQAGRKLINYGYIDQVFRSTSLKNVEYYVHE